jgi:beta-hydroxyacyl-ACP dehydratase FabZ
LLKIEQILRILPHRYPFLLVDKVLDLEKGKSIVAIKNVTYNESFFQGHFPEYKVMPGVLVVEAMAQAGGILLFHSVPDPQGKLVFFSKIDNMKFRKPVVPGDQLRLDVELLRLKSRFSHMKAKASVQEETVAEGDIMAFLVDLEELNE